MYTIYFDGNLINADLSGADFAAAMYGQFRIIAETLELSLIMIDNSTGEVVAFENIPEWEYIKERERA